MKNEALMAAIKADDVEALRAAISSGEDVNYVQIDDSLIYNRDGADIEQHIETAPLVAAVRKGNSEMIELMLDAGADVNLAFKHNMELMATCACERTMETVEHQTALSLSLLRGEFKLAERLIKRGADVTFKPVMGVLQFWPSKKDGQNFGKTVTYSLLHLAVRSKAPAGIIKALIKGGVDIDFKAEFPTESGCCWLSCWCAGIVFLWIPCLIALYNCDCDGTLTPFRDYTADELGEHIGMKRAASYIKSHRDVRARAAGAYSAGSSNRVMPQANDCNLEGDGDVEEGMEGMHAMDIVPRR